MHPLKQMSVFLTKDNFSKNILDIGLIADCHL